MRGSGVFVGGHGDWAGKGDGGVLRVSHLRTGEIHTDGGIPEATPDLISGGVFVISGAVVEQVTNAGPVTTYGHNDMVLDNKGARGFNLYDGSLRQARFASVATRGDGSVGIQISKPLGTLTVSGDVTTSGGEGLSLVKGVQVVLKAVGLSIKPGGEVGSIAVGGQIASTGDGVNTVEIEGLLNRLEVRGGINASGKGSDAGAGGSIRHPGAGRVVCHGRPVRMSPGLVMAGTGGNPGSPRCWTYEPGFIRDVTERSLP